MFVAQQAVDGGSDGLRRISGVAARSWASQETGAYNYKVKRRILAYYRVASTAWRKSEEVWKDSEEFALMTRARLRPHAVEYRTRWEHEVKPLRDALNTPCFGSGSWSAQLSEEAS